MKSKRKWGNHSPRNGCNRGNICIICKLTVRNNLKKLRVLVGMVPCQRCFTKTVIRFSSPSHQPQREDSLVPFCCRGTACSLPSETRTCSVPSSPVSVTWFPLRLCSSAGPRAPAVYSHDTRVKLKTLSGGEGSAISRRIHDGEEVIRKKETCQTCVRGSALRLCAVRSERPGCGPPQ